MGVQIISMTDATITSLLNETICKIDISDVTEWQKHLHFCSVYPQPCICDPDDSPAD